MANSSNQLFIKRLVIALCVMLGLLLIDIATKLAVHISFNGVEGTSIEVIKGFFWIRLAYNSGAAWSLFAGEVWGRVVLSLLSLGASAVSIYYLVKHFNDLHIVNRIALYLFIPGCVGNLIDRANLYNTKGVIDFLSFRLFGFYNFPIFNFADSCLVISVILFAVFLIFFDKDKKDEEIEKIVSGEEE